MKISAFQMQQIFSVHMGNQDLYVEMMFEIINAVKQQGGFAAQVAETIEKSVMGRPRCSEKQAYILAKALPADFCFSNEPSEEPTCTLVDFINADYYEVNGHYTESFQEAVQMMREANGNYKFYAGDNLALTCVNGKCNYGLLGREAFVNAAMNPSRI